MNDLELAHVREAFRHTLEHGAPGLSHTMRHALVATAMVRLSKTLSLSNVPEAEGSFDVWTDRKREENRKA
jgi:hypothetical protein